jgi:Protein of unknown function (DUF3176)
MRPASWLSALLSANGIFLHFALEEGLTVAWWYRASMPDATVRELHDAWRKDPYEYKSVLYLLRRLFRIMAIPRLTKY